MSHPCPRCEKPFKTPATLARHTGAKKQCAPVAALRDEIKMAAAADPLARNIWEARNLMRRAGVTGMESLDCIVALFALREAERLYPRLADPASWGSTKRLPMDIKYAVECGLVLFSQIAARPYDDGENKGHWHTRVRNALAALEHHPDTKVACEALYKEPAKMFSLSDSAATHALVRHVRDRIPFDGAADSAGRAFMTVVRDFLDGKELGQFFTPPLVVDYLATRAAEGRALGRTFDPTCGSGGFLAAAARAGAAEVHGCEIDIRVRLLGYFNALVSGAVAPRVDIGDFTRVLVPGAPFDTVLANPPFGIKGIKHPELVKGLGEEEGNAAFPLKSSATGLFLQRIVRCLAIGGRGCVVLPLGKELAGRSAAEVLLRRALLTAVDLCEVVSIPAGAFENTGIRTVALVFDKRRELRDCLEDKQQSKGTAIELRPRPPPVAKLRPGLAPATSDIRLVQLRTAPDGKTVIAEVEPIPGTQGSVSLKQLEEAAWSLSPDDYKIAAPASAPGAAPLSDYPMVRLGDISEFKAGMPLSKAELANSGTPVVGGGRGLMGHSKCSENRRNCTVISVRGSIGAMQWVEGGFFLTNNGASINLRSENVSAKYVHYAVSQLPVAQLCSKGSTIPMLDAHKLTNLEIPLPPLEIQRAIAAELDAQAADVASLEKAAAAAERGKRIALDNALYRRGYLRALNEGNRLSDGVELVRLGDICEFKAGVQLSKAELVNSGTPVVGGGRGLMGYSGCQENRRNCTVISVRGSIGTMQWVEGGFFLTNNGASVNLKTENISAKYVHYAVSQLPIAQLCSKGSTIPMLDTHKLTNLEIPLPLLEVQRAIAAELDVLDVTARGLTAAAGRARAAMKMTLARAVAGDAVAVEDCKMPDDNVSAAAVEDCKMPDDDVSAEDLGAEIPEMPEAPEGLLAEPPPEDKAPSAAADGDFDDELLALLVGDSDDLA